MTRKSKFLVPSAAALLGLAVVTALWLRHGNEPAPDDATSQPAAPSAQKAPPADEPPDPQVLSQIREAYQSSLAENAPPGMVELMQGSDKKPADLPPLPDPFVVPAGHTDGPSADLPPLSSPSGAKPKPLPPIDATPTPAKAPKEGPAPDLPPLPPIK